MGMKRRKESSSGFYHVVGRGINKEQIFGQQRSKIYFKKCIIKYLEQYDVEIYAYCIMSNHFHMILKSEIQNLSSYMARVLAEYAFYYNFKNHRNGHVFQNRFLSECIETEGYFWNCVRYIHNNPVKANMVKKAVMYKYSSMGGYITGTAVVLTKNAFSMYHGRFAGRGDFEEFHMWCQHTVFSDIKDEVEEQRAEIAIDIAQRMYEEKNLQMLIQVFYFKRPLLKSAVFWYTYREKEWIIMDRKNVWKTYSAAQLDELNKVNEDYKMCLDAGKTERECVSLTVDRLKRNGYISLEEAKQSGKALKTGDKVYAVCMGKSVAAFHMGSEPLENGMNILGAHIDSPRIDVKQNPLYESEEFAYLDTHYYGGIKKYQWVTFPLALHGVVAKKDGEVVEISIGEKDDDPVFVITDLLVHLASKQMEKKANAVIEGEKLDLLFASRPLSENEELDKEQKEAVKANVLRLLKEYYRMEEEDFVSAELEIVPAGRARDCGIDRSMVMAYGQDDRVCAFTSLFALLDVESVSRTACCILVDKEEIGSVGATGMHSRFFENVVAELVALTGRESELKVRHTLQNSKMLSSDVSAAYDPMFAEAFEKRSSAFFAKGLVFNKFTGSRGKNGSNDANAEYLAQIRRAMDAKNVAYQFAELGKVDAGGGGTIAYIMANYGMEVIDSGVAVLSMHAPWEVVSKADVYEAYKGYMAFLQEI